MLGYRYEITYKKRTENTMVDTLTRRDNVTTNSSIIAISVFIPVWIQEIIDSYTFQTLWLRILFIN